MADNAVFVEFGAKIDGLVSGVNEVKQQLSSLNSSAESLSSGFSQLKDIIVATFSVDALVSFIERMGALGLSVERNMAILGASAQEVVQLSGVAQLVGQDMDSLSIQLNRLTLNVQKSTRDAFNPQAQALKLLGINAQQFIAMPFEGKIDALHNAVQKFNPSLNLTNVLTEIGGRGFASQLPLLQKTNEQWAEMQAAVARAREGLAAAIPGMADTHEKLTIMSESVQSLGARIFSVLKPAIDAGITAFTKFVQSIDTGTIQSAMSAVIDSVATFLTSLINVAEGLGGMLDAVGAKVRGILSPLIVLNAVTDALAAALKKATDFVMSLGGAIAESTKPVAEAAAIWDKLRKSIEDARAAMQGFVANQGKATATDAPARQNMGAINFEAAKASSDRLKIIDNEYKLAVEIINKSFGDFVFTEGAKTAALLAALDKRYHDEVAAGEKTSVAYSKFALDRQKILDAANKVYEKSLNEAFSGLQSAINGQLRGMLAGTTSFAQGFKAIIGDMIIWAIQEIEKLAFKWLAHELIMTTATETGVATRTASEATGAAAAEGTQIAKALASIFRSAGETFAGVFAFLAPVMGPAAAGPAAASEATVLGVGMSIAGAAVGTDYIARTGLVTVHQGEAIVPAQFNPGFTGVNPQAPAIGSLTISAVDSRSFASMLQSNPAPFVALLKRVIRDGLVNLEPAR